MRLKLGLKGLVWDLHFILRNLKGFFYLFCGPNAVLAYLRAAKCSAVFDAVLAPFLMPTPLAWLLLKYFEVNK